MSLATQVCRSCGATFRSGISYVNKEYCKTCWVDSGLSRSFVDVSTSEESGASAVSRRDQSRGHPVTVIIASAVVMVGFFLPWLSFENGGFRGSVSGDEIAKALDSYWLVFGGGLAAASITSLYFAKTFRDARAAVAVSGWIPLSFLVVKIARALTGTGLEGFAVGSSGMKLGIGLLLCAGGLLVVALGAPGLKRRSANTTTAMGGDGVVATGPLANQAATTTGSAASGRYCGQCGKPVLVSNAFCTSCGQKLD